jgi:hypothetical protein
MAWSRVLRARCVGEGRFAPCEPGLQRELRNARFDQVGHVGDQVKVGGGHYRLPWRIAQPAWALIQGIAIISLLLSARAKISYAFALVSLGVFLKLLALKRDKHGLPYLGARILLLTVARIDVGCDRG